MRRCCTDECLRLNKRLSVCIYGFEDQSQKHGPTLFCDSRSQVEDGCGLRLDGTLSHPPSGQQIWYDTTTVHTTCRSKIKKELVLTRNRRAAGKEGKDMQSAGLMAVHQKKLDRYSLLAALAERQVLDGHLSFCRWLSPPTARSVLGQYACRSG
jgi:hypothetical protein